MDFDPVIKISKSYTVLVTTPSLPVNSLSDLVALLKSKPGQLNFLPPASAPLASDRRNVCSAGRRARTHVPYQQFPRQSPI